MWGRSCCGELRRGKTARREIDSDPIFCEQWIANLHSHVFTMGCEARTSQIDDWIGGVLALLVRVKSKVKPRDVSERIRVFPLFFLTRFSLRRK